VRLLPAGRAAFDDLKIKPPQLFDEGLFWRDRHARKLLAGSMLPQGWVRTGVGDTPRLSDDALGLHWSLIGFGVDPAQHLDPTLLERWSRLGGKAWQWCHRSQAQHLAPADRRLEALDESLLPRLAPMGWVAIVRPDRCVMAEGPVSEVDPLLQRALGSVEPVALSQERRAPRRHPAVPRIA
jgi:3-(3-hydroxy-phenyl)propionate hydroxylase